MTVRSCHRRTQGGFTLLEVLVSIAILSFMMVAAWATMSNTASAKAHVEEVTKRTHELRVAMAIMVRDLAHAYLSANEDQSRTDRRTMFIGQPKGDIANLRFSSMGHRVLWANADESEQTLIAYFDAPDRDDSSKTDIIRHEARRLSNEQWESEPADREILLRDVEKLELEYYDWKEDDWTERWDSTQADAQAGRLPTRVRIKVTANLSPDHPITLTTEARINLQEELRFFAN